MTILCLMKRIWQVVMLLGSLATPAWAQEKSDRNIQWTPLKIQASAFSRDLGLLDAERDEYATNLADCAALAVIKTKATQESLEQARKFLSLALNLSPRNRRAIVVNYQLSKGLLPDAAKGDFSPPTLARLLLTRGQILAKSDSQENRMLARMFSHLAAELDPKNEDAIYASEVDRLDHGNLDWTFLTRPLVTEKPAPTSPPEAPSPTRPSPPAPPPGTTR
jgi:hypothetical protein